MDKKNQAKRKIRQHRYFSEDFKIQKVKEIEQNLISVSELSRLYEVSDTAIYNWIYKYSVHLKKGVTQVIEMESESRKTKKLQERLAELERVIGQKQLQIDYLEKVIEFSSEELGNDIKKKYDTESLDGLHQKREDTL
jgi:transposase-like protein